MTWMFKADRVEALRAAIVTARKHTSAGREVHPGIVERNAHDLALEALTTAVELLTDTYEAQ